MVSSSSIPVQIGGRANSPEAKKKREKNPKLFSYILSIQICYFWMLESLKEPQQLSALTNNTKENLIELKLPLKDIENSY